MFRFSQFAYLTYSCMAIAIYALLDRYMVNPIPFFLLATAVLVISFLRRGKPLEVSKYITIFLVFMSLALLNIAVFVLKFYPERALVIYLTALMLAKSFSLRKVSDYSQVMFLTVLSIMASGSFSPTPSFPVILILYTILAALWIFKVQFISEILAHSSTEPHIPTSVASMEPRRWTAPFLCVTILTLVVGSAFYQVIPRSETSLFKLKTDYMGKSISTGFSDTMQLGELGYILEDKTGMLRVKSVDESRQSNYTGSLYLRGAAFDCYVRQNDQWKWIVRSCENQTITVQSDSLSKPALIQSANFPAEYQTLWQVYYERPNSSNIFIIDRPIAIAANQKFPLAFNPDYLTISSSQQTLPRGFTYQLLSERILESSPTEITSRRLMGNIDITKFAHTIYCSIFDQPSIRSLGQLLFSEGVRDVNLAPFKDLADNLTRTLPADASRLDKLRCIENWLKGKEFSYSLNNLDVDLKKEPVFDFLSRRKHGHCEYYASALALMAQSMGLPARVVIGYKGGSFNSFGGYYLVRNCDAHAWSEISIPKEGWIRFDPTPSAREDFLREFDNPRFKWFWEVVDMLQYRWSDRLTELETGNRNEFLKSLRQTLLEPYNSEKSNLWTLKNIFNSFFSLVKGKNFTHTRLQIVHSIIALVLIIITVMLMRIVYDVLKIVYREFQNRFYSLWASRYGKIWYCPIDFYRRLLLWMAVRGVVRQPTETAREFSIRIANSFPKNEKNLKFITEVYLALRFGDKELDDEQSRHIENLTKHTQDLFLEKGLSKLE